MIDQVVLPEDLGCFRKSWMKRFIWARGYWMSGSSGLDPYCGFTGAGLESWASVRADWLCNLDVALIQLHTRFQNGNSFGDSAGDWTGEMSSYGFFWPHTGFQNHQLWILLAQLAGLGIGNTSGAVQRLAWFDSNSFNKKRIFILYLSRTSCLFVLCRSLVHDSCSFPNRTCIPKRSRAQLYIQNLLSVAQSFTAYQEEQTNDYLWWMIFVIKKCKIIVAFNRFWWSEQRRENSDITANAHRLIS